MKTPIGPQLILEYHCLFKFSVNISTLRHLVGNELSCLQAKKKKPKTEKCFFPVFHQWPSVFVKKGFLTWLLVRLYAFVDLWCSTETRQVTIWTTSPFSPLMAPWMASFTSMSICRAGASSAAWNTWKSREGRGDEWENSKILHVKHLIIMEHPAWVNQCDFKNTVTVCILWRWSHIVAL